MATVADILSFMESLAPAATKMNWDNVGLLCGRKDKEVTKVLVALDPFRNVIQEAIDMGADCIVTHHPLIFRNPLMAVNDDTETGRCVLTLIEHGIAAINAHTNLDVAAEGVNEVLARTLGLNDIAVINPEGEDAQGRPYGLLRCGTVGEITLKAFLTGVKEKLDCDGLRYVDSGKPVRKVAVGGGSCAGEMMDAIAAGCDTFVTADVRYNQFREAYELGLNLIDAGHFHTENPTMPVIAEKLRQAFPETKVIFSENHRECMKFFV